MVQVGIIGCGKQAPKHIAALKKLNIGKIIICDIVPETAKQLASQHNIFFYDHPDNLMQDYSIDVIDICTPTPTHFRYAQKALQSGKHVFCEKPLTTSSHEAEQLLDLTRRRQRLGMVAFVYKYHPLFVQVKSALEAGLIGPLRAIFMRLGGKGSHRAWKHQTETGGGAVNEMMSHMLDVLLWFIGDVEQVETVNLDNLIKQRHIDGAEVSSYAEDFALVIGKSVTGTKFVVESDLISQSYTNHIEIIGEDGYINFSILDSQESYIFLNRAKPLFAKGKNPLKNKNTDLFELMFADFFQSIRGQRNLKKNTFAEALKLAQLIEKIKKKKGT